MTASRTLATHSGDALWDADDDIATIIVMII